MKTKLFLKGLVGSVSDDSGTTFRSTKVQTSVNQVNDFQTFNILLAFRASEFSEYKLRNLLDLDVSCSLIVSLQKRGENHYKTV